MTDCPHCGRAMDPWENAAKTVAEFVAEMNRMEKANSMYWLTQARKIGASMDALARGLR